MLIHKVFRRPFLIALHLRLANKRIRVHRACARVHAVMQMRRRGRGIAAVAHIADQRARFYPTVFTKIFSISV